MKQVLENLSDYAGVMKLKNGSTLNFGSIRVEAENFYYYTGKGLREMHSENSDKASELKRLSESELITSKHIAIISISEIESLIS